MNYKDKKCDVTDIQGNHCPEVPEYVYIFDGVETYLCRHCFVNVVAGAYGYHLAQLVVIDDVRISSYTT